jgi:DNA-binding GntR family transcriptional regulator
VGSPLYARLREDLRASIEKGEYAVGDYLPTEAELCRTFGASRHTVREALRGLVEAGMIERRQGAGSKVVPFSLDKVLVQSVAHSFAEIWETAKATRLTVGSSEIAALDDAESDLMGVPVGSRWLRIEAERRTLEGNRLINTMVIYAHARFNHILKDLGNIQMPLFAIVESHSGERVEEAIVEISTCYLTKPEAERLHQDEGSAALKIVRRYLDVSGSTMLVGVNYHPAETFTYKIKMERKPDRS